MSKPHDVNDKSKYMGNTVDPKKFPGSRGKNFVDFLANDIVQKLESVPFQFQEHKELLQFTRLSNFSMLRQKLGRICSLEGKAALFILPYKDGYIADVMSIERYTMIGKMEQEVVGISGSLVVRNDEKYPLMTKMSFVNGKPTLTKYIKLNPKADGTQFTIEEIGQPFIYESIDFLPVEVFFNNDQKKSDVDYANLAEELHRLEKLDANLFAEYNRTKTLVMFNTNFTTNIPEETVKKIDEGAGFFEENALNSKYGVGTQVIPATNGATLLLSLIVALEDDMYRKCGLPRDTINNGSNNHNLEIVMANQFGLEYLLTRQLLRQNHYDDFFMKFKKLLKVKFENPILEISPIETSKLRLLEATVLEAEIKAKNLANQDAAQTTPTTQGVPNESND